MNCIRLNNVESVSLAVEEQSSADLRDAVTAGELPAVMLLVTQ
ncbi:hypothetical protein [Streptomyces chartreusis]